MKVVATPLAVMSFVFLILASSAFAVAINQTNSTGTNVYIHGGNASSGGTGYADLNVTNATHGQLINQTLSGFVCATNQCNFTVVLDNDLFNSTNWTFKITNFTRITGIYYNASDGNWRNITELPSLGQGSFWNWTRNSSQITLVNYTLAGGDGYDNGIRDNLAGGSYWLDENGTSFETGLVGYWKFGEGSGGNVSDSSSYNNTGAVIGATWNTSCKFGSCLSFDGNDYASVTGSFGSLSRLTLTTWVKFNQVNSNNYLIHENSDKYIMQVFNNKLRGTVNTGSDVVTDGATTINANQWYHLAVVYNGGNVKVYVNGIDDQPSPTAGTGTVSGGNTVVLGGKATVFFNGAMDEARVYNRALSSDEIKRLYESTSINLKSDFISARVEPYIQLNLTNSTGQTIFQQATENILLDNSPITTAYPVNASTTYFFDWKDNDWKVWQKNNYVDALVGWWKMDDGQTQNVTDFSGKGNKGVLGNTSASEPRTDPVWVSNSSCKYGSCLNFNGSQFVNVVDSASLDITSSLTVSAWVKANSLANYLRVVDKDCAESGCGDSNRAYILALDDGGTSAKMSFFINGWSANSRVIDTSVFPTNAWVYVTGVFDDDANELKLYRDGNLVATTTGVTATPPNTAEPLKIGAYNNSGAMINFWNGMIDDVKIYSRALSAEEIKSEYLNTKRGMPDWTDPRFKQEFKWMQSFSGGNQPGINLTYLMTAVDPFVKIFVDSGPTNEYSTIDSNTVGLWRFDEGSGTSTADASQYGNTGTLTNMNTIGNATSGWNSTDCKFGRCLKFDGVNDYASTSTDISSYTQLTISAWIKANTGYAFYNPVVVQADSFNDNDGVGLAFHESGNVYIFHSTTDASRTERRSATTLNDSSWHHVAGVIDFDNDQIHIYVDGKLDDTTTGYAIAGKTPETYTNKIGSGGLSAWTKYFNGTIDEVRIWNKALTADEIIAEYQRGAQHNIAIPIKLGQEKSYNSFWEGTAGAGATCNDAYIERTPVSAQNVWIVNNTGIIRQTTSSGSWDSLTESCRGLGKSTIAFNSKTSSDSVLWFEPNWQAGINKRDNFEVRWENISAPATAYGKLQYFYKFNSTSNNNFLFGLGYTGTIDTSSWADASKNQANTQIGFSTETLEQIANSTLSYYDLKDPNLVAWYKFNDASFNITDSSGNGNNGKANNNVTWVTNSSCLSEFGYCGSFNGSFNYVDVNDSSSLKASSLTISAWVKTMSPSSNQIIATKRYSWGNNPWNSFILDISSATQNYRLCLSTGVSGSQSCITSTTSSASDWKLITGTYDGSTMRIFVNGVQENSAAFSGPIGYSSEVLRIGSDNSNGWVFNGLMDNVKIFSRALTAEEIFWEYQQQKENYPNWFKFDKGNTQHVSTPEFKYGYKDDKYTWFNDTWHYRFRVETIAVSNYTPTYLTTTFAEIPGKFGVQQTFDPNSIRIVEYYENGTLNDYNSSYGDSRKYEFPYKAITLNETYQNITLSWILDGPYNSSSTRYWYVYFDDQSSSKPVATYDETKDIWLVNDTSRQLQFHNSLYRTNESILNGTNLINYNFTFSVTNVSYIFYADSDLYNSTMRALDIYMPINSIGEIYYNASDNTWKNITELFNIGQGQWSYKDPSVVGLIGWWKFDEGSGTSAGDSSNTGKTGALTNFDWNASSNWNTSCKFGSCIVLDGVNDYMWLGQDKFTTAQTTEGTIEMWFNPSTLSPSSQYLADFEGAISIRLEPNQVRGYNDGSGGGVTYAITQPNTWYHLVMAWDNSTNNLYVNGKQVSSVSANTYSLDSLTRNQTIGAQYTYNNYFNGIIDDVKVYNRALSDDEVKREYLHMTQVLRLNNTLAGGDGYDNGIRDNLAGGSYWLDENGRSLETGLVGYWQMGEGSGTTVADSSGNGNTGTFTTPPNISWVAGKFGNAINVSGSNPNQGYLSVATSTSLNSINNTNNFTISAWMVVPQNEGTGVGGDSAISKGWPYFSFGTVSAADLRLKLRVSNNSAGNADNNVVTGTTALTQGVWQHVVAVLDNNQMKVYVNGNLDGTAFFPGNNFMSTAAWWMGKNDYGGYFHGQIDDVRIYNRALSADEIKRLYESTSINLKSDFISARAEPYIQLNLTNSTGQTIFQQVSENILLDNSPITTAYPVNASTTYFFDWKENDWKVWQKNNYIDALVGYWKFDEGQTNLTADSSGKGNNGTLGNNSADYRPIWITNSSCRSGSCLNFNGNKFVNISNSPSLNFTNMNSITLEAWIYMNNIGAGGASPGAANPIISEWQTSNAPFLFVVRNTGQLRLLANAGASSLQGDTVLSTNNWYHVVATYDGSQIKLYLNGLLDASTSTSFTFSGSPQLEIGYNANTGNYFNGTLDDVKIYSRALSAEEIKSEYQNTKRGMPDWTDPRFKQEFKWMQSFSNITATTPQINITYSMTATDPFVRVFVDVKNATNSPQNNITIPINFGYSKSRSYMKLGGVSNGWNEQQINNANPWIAVNDSVGWTRTDGTTEADWITSSLIAFVSRSAGDQPLAIAQNYQFGKAKHNSSQIKIENTTSTTQYGKATYFYKFNSTTNNNFMFSLVYPGSIDTSTSCDGLLTCSWSQSSPWQFSNETLEQVANSTLTYYDLLDNKLMAWYKFNDASYNISDSSGKGNNGRANTNYNWLVNSSCKSGFGYCGVFNGTTIVDTGNTSSFDIKDQLTISAWIKIPAADASNYQTIVSKFVEQPQFTYKGYSFYVGKVSHSGHLFTDLGCGAGSCVKSLQGNTNVADNQWHHVVLTYDKTAVRFYVDGKQDASSAWSNEMAVPTDVLLLGAFNANYAGGRSSYFNGLMDNVKIYSRALSADEILWDYQQQKENYPNWFKIDKGNMGNTNVTHTAPANWNYDSGAVGIWRLNEGAGGNVTDSSGNGKTGHLNNTALWTSNGCRSGNCLNFTGNSYITLGTDTYSTSTFANGTTVEAWMYPASLVSYQSYNAFVSIEGRNDLNLETDGRIRYYIGGSTIPANLFSVTKPIVNNWYHVVGTWDGTTQKLYVNGRLDNSTTLAESPFIDDVNRINTIGGHFGLANFFNGSVDEVRIYSRALTDQEVWDHYSQGVSKYYDDFNVGAKRNYGVEDSSSNLQPITPVETVLHYRFNQNSSVNATDVSGNTNDGMLVGSVAWITNSSCMNSFGGCVRFDGSTGYILSKKYINATSIALSAWFNLGATSSSNQWIIGTDDNNIRQCNLYVEGTSNRISFYCYNSNTDGATIQQSPAINANQWYHAVGVYDTSAQKLILYVNGVNVMSSTYGSGLAVHSGVLPNIGRSAVGNSYFKGLIDEAMIVNHSLSADEVYQLYQGGYNRYTGDLVGWWKFNEVNSSLNAIDSSGNGNTGTLTGMTTNGTETTSGWNTTDCKLNSCLKFDGVDDYVNAGNAASLDITNAITIEAWAKANSLTSTGDGIVYKPAVLALDFKSDGAIRSAFYTSGNGVFTAYDSNAGEVLVNNWYHAAVTYDGANWRIYKNGVEVKNGALTGTIQTSTNALKIGEEANSNYNFNGSIDNVKIFSRALTAEEIRQEYLQSNDQYSQYNYQHRVASADGTTTVAYNLTDKDIFTQQDYDQRLIKVVVASNNVTQSRKDNENVYGGKYADDFATGIKRNYGVEDSSSNLEPIAPNNTVLHLRFNEGKGTQVYDLSGQKNNGTLNGGVAWVSNSTCRTSFGSCLGFDGSNDYVNVADSNNLDLPVSFAISAWVNLKDLSSHHTIIDKATYNTDGYEFWWQANTGFYLRTHQSGAFQTTTSNSISTNQWYHVVAVSSPNGGKIYINGTDQTASSANHIVPVVNTLSVNLGSHQTGANWWNGMIDEVMIINRSLTSDEVYQMYLGGINRTVGNNWHRIASTDGIPAAYYNISDHDSAGQQDYDQRKILITGNLPEAIINFNASKYKRGDMTNITMNVSSDMVQLPSASIIFPNGTSLSLQLYNETATGVYKTNYTFTRFDPPGAYYVNVTDDAYFTNATNKTMTNNITLTIESPKMDSSTRRISSKGSQDIFTFGRAYYESDNSSVNSTLMNASYQTSGGGITLLGTNTTNSSGDYLFTFKFTYPINLTYTVAINDTNNNGGSNSTIVTVLTKPLFVKFVNAYKIGTSKTNDVWRFGTDGLWNFTAGSSTANTRMDASNLTKTYVCTYDQAEYSNGMFVSLIQSGDKRNLEYVNFSNNAGDDFYKTELKQSIDGADTFLAFGKGTCNDVDSRLGSISGQTMPNAPIGSYSLGGTSGSDVQISLTYDRILLNGTDRFTLGSNDICIKNAKITAGNEPLIDVRRC